MLVSQVMATGFSFKTLLSTIQNLSWWQKRVQVSQKYRLTNNSSLDSDTNIHSTIAQFRENLSREIKLEKLQNSEGELNNATQFLNTWGVFYFFASNCCLLCAKDNRLFWPRFVMRISTISYWGSAHTRPRRIWKRSVISAVRPTVHTNLSRKQSFISTVRPTVHTNPSRKRRFSKTPIKLEEFENASFSFSCGRKTFWKRSFSKTMTSW